MSKPMREFFLGVVASVLLSSAAAATPLTVVEVSAPDINCVFDADCRITVSDSSAPISLPGSSGEGFLQSRTGPAGEAGTAGQGLTPYEYRVDLRAIGGLTALPCITELSIDFGEHRQLDYNGDGRVDDVFVVTGGGLGSVGLSSVERDGDRISFRFAPAVCAGNRPGAGESSFFFGLAAAGPPGPVIVQASGTLGVSLDLDARAPVGGRSGGGASAYPCVLAAPFVGDVPVCRCLRDPGHQELRCGVLFPDFLLVRGTPLPIPPAEPFKVSWTLVPIGKRAGSLLVEDALPPGFERRGVGSEAIKFRTGSNAERSQTLAYQLETSKRDGTLGMSTLVTFAPDGSNDRQSTELLLPIGPLPWPNLDDAPAEPRPFPPADPDFGDDACGRAAARLWEEHLVSFGASIFGPSLAAYRDLQIGAARCRRAMPSYSGLCAGPARNAFAGCFLRGDGNCRLAASRTIERCREDLFGGLGGPIGCPRWAMLPCP